MIPDSGMVPWFERLREEIPQLEPLDAHTHIGSNDPDGYRCSREQLTSSLERVDARAFVFPMHEPEGYSAASIDPAARGVGLLLQEGGIPVRLRSCYLDDLALADLARRSKGLTPAVIAQVVELASLSAFREAAGAGRSFT